MNRIRRKQIAEIMERIESIRSDLETVSEEEEEARDAIPENLWGSERYEAADEACSNLEDALNSLEEALGYLEEAST